MSSTFRSRPALLVLLSGAIAAAGTVVANAMYAFTSVELLGIFLVAILGAGGGLVVVDYALQLDDE